MDALANHHGPVSISGKNLTYLRYANNTDRLAGNEEELTHLVQCLDETWRAYGMEINVDKTKMMANAYGGTRPEIMVNCHALQTVKEFQHLGSIVLDKGLKQEVLVRTAQALSAIARLWAIWADKGLKLAMKIKHTYSIIFSIFLYTCETWTLNADLECRIWARICTLTGRSSTSHTETKYQMRKSTA